MYGCTSPREPMVRNVKCSERSGLKERNVDDCDVNMYAGADSVELARDSLMLCASRGPNSSRMSASWRASEDACESPDVVRCRTVSSCFWMTLMNASRRSSSVNSKNSSSWPLTITTRP